MADSPLVRCLAGAFTAGDGVADEGDELAAELAGVLEGFEAADEDAGDAGVVVAEEGFGDLLGRADEGRGVGASAGGGGDGHPEAVVDDVLLGGASEETLRAGGGSRGGWGAAKGDDPLQIGVGLVPGLGLGLAEDGADGDAEG